MIIQVTHHDRELVVLTDKGKIFKKTFNDKWRKVELPNEDEE